MFLWLVMKYSKLKYEYNLKRKIEDDFGKRSIGHNLKIDFISDLYYRENKEAYSIDDITFYDLNLDKVFLKIEHSYSTLGIQYLYKLLREPKFNREYFVRLREIRDSLIDNKKIAKDLAFEFSKLGFFKEQVIETIYKGVDYSKYKSYKLPVYILSFNVLLIIINIFLKSSLFTMYIMLSFIFSFYVKHQMKKASQGKILQYQVISEILGLSKSLEKYNIDFLNQELENLRGLNIKLKNLRKKISGIEFKGYGTENDIFLNLLDTIFMISSRNFFASSDEINRNSKELKNMYLTLGKIESYLSIASLYLSGDYVDVEFIDEDFKLSSKNLSHILLDENQVRANFNFNDENILLTGSNASGKSTFLRNIGIANVLATSLGFVKAEEYKTSFFYIQSAIDISDSIEKSMSYFMAETIAIKRMIKDEKVKKLLILDEIFKGTNTIDRISAAYNTLIYLGKDKKVIAATHDIELTSLLKNNFKNYHFEEIIKDKDILFDYTLKEGPANSRNAIEILRVQDYPDEIVERAKEMAEKFERGKW
ncbi:MAG: MutS-related protein [Peptoniphilaceae bacterium]